MAQQAKVIDTTHTYIPVDPNTFPENLHGTSQEDYPTDKIPVIPFDGFNFLPTDYGYKSFFSTNAQVAVEALPVRASVIFIIQTHEYKNTLVALTEDGIYTFREDSGQSWYKELALPPDEEGFKSLWTYTVIEKTLYCYRQGWDKLAIFRTGPTADIIDAKPPATTLTVAPLEQALYPFAAGIYEFAISYIDPYTGWRTAPTEFQSVTLTATESVYLKFDVIPEVSNYRLYKKDPNGDVVYHDLIVAQGQLASFEYTVNTNTVWTSIVLPDEDWLHQSSVSYAHFYARSFNFLSPAGQIGIFKAGSRLGFWDSANSLAWSSIDNFLDFTPSIQTLAGSAIFNNVLGRITNIIPHGDGFIIYATKNIVYVRRKVDATFQWEPTTVLNTGVIYPEQCVAGTPDTIHYAWTVGGFYKIEEGRPEFSTPAFFDYMTSTKLPVRLDFLNNRYLFISTLNANFVNGKTRFTVNTVPRTTITFPQDQLDTVLGEGTNLVGNDACYYLDLVDQQHNQNVKDSHPEVDPKNWQALYDVHYSLGFAPASITWVDTPCGPTDAEDAPVAMTPEYGRVEDATQDTTNKLSYSYQPEDWPYIPDSTRFAATQFALWRMEELNRSTYLRELISKRDTSEKTITFGAVAAPSGTAGIAAHGYHALTTQELTPVVSDTTVNACDLGWFIFNMSDPVWGANSCGLFLQRYITQRAKLIVKKRTITRTEPVKTDVVGWHDWNHGITTLQNTAYDVAEIRGNAGVPSVTDRRVIFLTPTFAVGQVKGFWHQTWTFTCNPKFFQSFEYRTTTTVYIWIEVETIETGIFGVETAYMQIREWYNRSNSAERLPALPSCPSPISEMPDTPPSNPRANPVALDGSMCGIPFDPIYLAPFDLGDLAWPIQSVTFPPTAFLLQQGSNAPYYPTYEGAFVYDTHYKKWGKYKGQYKLLLDYLPVNSSATDVIDFNNFGVESGILGTDNNVYLFGPNPAESEIVYGKLGYYRLGFTNLQEFRVHFATPATGSLLLEQSIDGKHIENLLTQSDSHNGVMQATLFANSSARWYNLIVTGYFDITHMEARGNSTARR